MICIAKTQNPPAWHAGFMAILPSIRRKARIAFRHLKPEAREDAVQETVANACLAPTYFANAVSNSCTRGPVPIQHDSSVFVTAAITSWSIIGLPKTI